MGHITPQSMGEHDLLGPFKPSPGAQLGQQGSENDYSLSQEMATGRK